MAFSLGLSHKPTSPRTAGANPTRHLATAPDHINIESTLCHLAFNTRTGRCAATPGPWPLTCIDHMYARAYATIYLASERGTAPLTRPRGRDGTAPSI